MDSQFMIVSGSSEYQIYDKKRMKLIRLQYGMFDDITDKCEKQYLKEKDKPRNKNGKKLGGLWYEFLNGMCDRLSACIWKDDVVLETDDQVEFDRKLLNLQREQLERILSRCNSSLNDLEDKRQYYIYQFSNH